MDNLFGDANFNVSKITNIFTIFLELIFKYVKKDIAKYQEENKEEKMAYNFDDKDMIIKKSNLASAIRLFITLVLYREEDKDKEEKIKNNKKNIIDYLKNKDLWKSTFYDNETNKLKFEGDLSKLKDLNIKVKEILYFYNYLIGNKDEGFEEEVKVYIREKEEEAKGDSEDSEDREDSEDSEYTDDSKPSNNVKRHIDDDD